MIKNYENFIIQIIEKSVIKLYLCNLKIMCYGNDNQLVTRTYR